jgi:hypothetical protein
MHPQPALRITLSLTLRLCWCPKDLDSWCNIKLCYRLLLCSFLSRAILVRGLSYHPFPHHRIRDITKSLSTSKLIIMTKTSPQSKATKKCFSLWTTPLCLNSISVMITQIWIIMRRHQSQRIGSRQFNMIIIIKGCLRLAVQNHQQKLNGNLVR